MWMPRWLFVKITQPADDLAGVMRAAMIENAELRGKLLELEKRALAADINGDWLRARVNQLEAERAILLSKQVGTPFFAPHIAKPGETTTQPGEGVPSIMDDLTFEDVGDDAAVRLGL